jgi:Holliday junction resolvasome RuvABC endonuclease subunit
MKLKIASREKKDYEFGKVETVKIRLDNERDSLGIDPGIRNMGMAKLYANGTGTLHQIKFTYDKDVSKMERMLQVWYAQSALTGVFTPHTKVIVEDAGYNQHFHQVKLAEMRAASILYYYRYDLHPLVLVPNTIRKSVFGSGKIKGWDMDLPPDAEAALVCALYKEEKNEPD